MFNTCFDALEKVHVSELVLLFCFVMFNVMYGRMIVVVGQRVSQVEVFEKAFLYKIAIFVRQFDFYQQIPVQFDFCIVRRDMYGVYADHVDLDVFYVILVKSTVVVQVHLSVAHVFWFDLYLF